MSNPFRSFIPYTLAHAPDLNRIDEEAHAALDPAAGNWRNVGLSTSVLKQGGMSLPLDGAGTLIEVQFNERILPGKVRDEELAKRVAKLEQQQGHKVSKKDYAQLRDQVEFDLLPRAFIRRTSVPVLFRSIVTPHMLVCTSSQKRADDVCAIVRGVFGETIAPWKLETNRALEAVLTTLAQAQGMDDDRFMPADAAVLKGSNKKTIRIKDKDMGDSDLESLLSEDYEVTELRIAYHSEGVESDPEAPDLMWTVNAKGIYKANNLPDVKTSSVKEDQVGLAAIYSNTWRDALRAWMTVCGGAKPRPDEDDEL